MIYLQDIKSKLVVENATDLSDKEIERIFTPCVCGHWLIPMAKEYRDKNILKYKNLKI